MSIELSLSSTYSTIGKPTRVKVWKGRVMGEPKSGECILEHELEVTGILGFTYLRDNRLSDEYTQIQQKLESKYGITPEQFKTLVDHGSVTV